MDFNFLNSSPRRKLVKKIIFASIAIFFILQASQIFALEFNYPNIPGAENPQEIFKKPSNEQLPLFANYVVRLFFLLTISIAILATLYGGILYVLSGVRPAAKLEANKKIKAGFLGLFIAACSYLVLFAINPQLVVFKIEKQKIYSLPSPAFSSSTNQVVYLEIPIGTYFSETIDWLDEEVNTSWGTPRIEVLFYETIDALDNAIKSSEQIRDSLEGCGCGESQYHIEFEGVEGKCFGGLKDGKTCPELCKDCGKNVSSCGIENVKKENGLRQKLQESLANLESKKLNFSSDQISLIEKMLYANSGNFLASELEGISFQENFTMEKGFFESLGYEVIIEKPKQFPNPQSVTMSPLALDPLTFFAIIKAPPDVISQDTINENKNVYFWSQRASIFAVLTQLSLEEISKMIQDCLSSAFGSGIFIIDAEEIEKIVENSVKNGLAELLGQNFEDMVNLSDVFISSLKQGLNEEISKQNCDPSNINEKCQEKRIAQCKTNCAVEFPQAQHPEENGICLRKCAESTIPPYFLSNQLAEFMTNDIREELPSEISKSLREKLRNFVFSQLNAFLDANFSDLLNKVLNGAMQKSLEEQIPFLKESLEKKLFQILPDLMLEPLQTVDVFLDENLKNINKKINNQVANIIKELTSSFTQPAVDIIEYYKKDNPNLFRENTPQTDCFNLEYEGYYFENESSLCLKASLIDINNWNSFKNSLLNFHDDESAEDFCRRAEYCWNKLSQKCEECQWLDFSGLSPTKENFKRLGQQFLTGLVSFSEQFLVALTQTAIHTLTKYTQVWIEDEIIAPLEPYLNQLSGFQKKLHQVLSSSIKELLPAQIAQYLSSNIEQILTMICQGRDIGLYQGMENIEISNDTKNAACNMKNELSNSVMDKIKESCEQNENSLGCEIVTALENTIEQNLKKAFCKDSQDKKCFLNVLDKSFAEILWPNVKNIKDLITGTPKKIICGELSAAGQTQRQKCDDYKDSSLTGNLLFYYQNPTSWKENLSEQEKAYCYFIWYGCDEPLKNWNQTVGNSIKKIFDQNCSGDQNEFCDATTHNSVAFSLFYYGLPKELASTQEEKNKEIATYQWLVVVFPDLTSDVRKLADKRGLGTMWRQGPEQEAINADKLSQKPIFEANAGDFVKAFVSWFSENKTVYDVLTDPSFGEMAYLKGENYQGKNFLSRELYQFIDSDVCGKIKSDFARDYPEKTFQKIWSVNYQYAPPYSMEALDRPTIAKVLDEIRNSDSIPIKRKSNYLTCLLLGYSPAEVLGLDQKLVRYVQPEQYQILFDLINDKLNHQTEMPAALRILLENYLYGKTPPKLLKEIGQANNDRYVQVLADFLDQKIGNQINKGFFAEQLIYAIFKTAFPTECENIRSASCPLFQKLGWQKWEKIQKLLAKTPTELASTYLTDPIIKDADKINFSLMQKISDPDKIEYSGDETVLGEPYIDTLGKALHLDKPIFEFFLAKDNLDKKINNAVISTKNALQGSFDKVFLEYPEAGLKWVANSLGRMVGNLFGEKTADKLAGICRQAEKQTDCGPNEAFKSETKECCSMGEGLTCSPRCRQKKDDEECNETLGETQVGSQCCFDDKCQKCRELKGGECNSDAKEKKIGDLCCRERTVKDDSCCVNILDCVADKFSSYLGQLKYYMIDGPSLNDLVSEKEETNEEKNYCPADLKSFCSNPSKIAVCIGVPSIPKRDPLLDKLLDCIEQKIGQNIPSEWESNNFYGSVFTYDHDHSSCNFTRGQNTCSSKCSHKAFSCHYGGYSGNNGALAIDFGNENNFEKIKGAAIACGTPENKILNEGDHIHISHSSCDSSGE